MPLYFAYGANMNVSAMARRCPRSKALGLARLVRHRLAVMREGWLTVARDPRSAVHGVLWDLALADVAALDRYEGLPQGLYAKLTQPVVDEPRAEAGDRLFRRQRRAGSRAPGLHRRGHRRGALMAAAGGGDRGAGADCGSRQVDRRRWGVGGSLSAAPAGCSFLMPICRPPVYLLFAAASAGSVPVTPPRLSQTFGSSWAWRL